MAKLKGLIIGAGCAGTAVANGMIKDGRAEPVGFVETNPERREELVKEFPGADVVDGDGFEALLAKIQPELVCDAGPDWLHAQHAVQSLHAGASILIEKPMCTSVDEAKAIRDAEEASGKIVTVDYTMRYSHPWGTMMHKVRQGEIGDIFYIGGFYIHDMYDWFAPDGLCRTPWRVDAKHPQNVLLGGGCHGLDLILCSMGEVPVETVYCAGNHLSGSSLPMEDFYQVTLNFANGTVGQVMVTVGCNSGSFGPMFEAYGTEGTLVEGKLLRRTDEPVELERIIEVDDQTHNWNETTRDFITAAEGGPNEMNSLMGARNVAVFHAALRSMESGKPEAVEWFV
jgi:predicted dehydrogenase